MKTKIEMTEEIAAEALEVIRRAVHSALPELRDEADPTFQAIVSDGWMIAHRLAEDSEWESADHLYRQLAYQVKLQSPAFKHNNTRLVRVKLENRDRVKCESLDAPSYGETDSGASFISHFDSSTSIADIAYEPESSYEAPDFGVCFDGADLTQNERLAMLELAVAPGRENSDAVARGEYAASITSGNIVVFPARQVSIPDPENPESALERTVDRAFVCILIGPGRNNSRETFDVVDKYCQTGRTTRSEWRKSALAKLTAHIEEENY